VTPSTVRFHPEITGAPCSKPSSLTLAVSR
jgi:hypothetical protein